MKVCGAKILTQTLRELGTEYVFGYPGFCVLPVYDELDGSGLKHVLTAGEQGACFAASGYARATRKPAVVLATSGPGATNLVTGIADAFLDSVPLVAITGNVDQTSLGHDAFQEVDTFGITMPVVKYNYLVKTAEEIEPTLREAFRLADDGRKGPVVVDIPHNLFLETADYPAPAKRDDRLRTRPEATAEDMTAAAKLIAESKRPAVYVGGGTRWAAAEREALALAERLGAPVTTSFMGISSVPAGHPLFSGVLTKGNPVARDAIANCDLLICLGTRFNNKFGWENFPKKLPNILHLDADRSEFSKNLPSSVGLRGDMATLLKALAAGTTPRNAWFEHGEIPCVQNRFARVLRELAALLPEEQTVVTDVGLHQLWTATAYPFVTPNTFVTSGGLGAMGFGTGAAIGVALATGKRPLLVTGDGSLNMNFNELATAVKYKLPVLVLVADNNSLGLIRAQQNAGFGGRHSESTLDTHVDYVGLARALGATGFVLGQNATADETHAILKKAISTEGVVLLDCKLSVNDTKY